MSPKPLVIELALAASPQQVWSELEQVEDHVEWMADAVEIRFHGEQRRGVGTRFACTTKVGPLRTVDEMTITEWEPGVRMGVEHRGAVQGRGAFELAAIPSGTLLTWREQLRFPLLLGGRLGARCARPVLKWIWARNLRRLSARVERRTSGAA